MAATTGKKIITALWVFVACGAGLGTAIAIGQNFAVGTAEIGGVMVATSIMCGRFFWDYHIKKWFIPLNLLFLSLNAAIFLWFIRPWNPDGSKGFIQLIWVDFFFYFGLLWLATRLWGDLPLEDDDEDRSSAS